MMDHSRDLGVYSQQQTCSQDGRKAVPRGLWGDQEKAGPSLRVAWDPWAGPPWSFYSRGVVFQGPPPRRERRKPLSERPPLCVPLIQTQPRLPGLHPHIPF